jgi:hypothetical protein
MYALQNALADLDQQELGVRGNESQQAMDTNFRLSDNDFQLQQANYGAYNDDIGRRVQQALAQAQMNQQAGMANVDAQNQGGMFNINRGDQLSQQNMENQRYIENQNYERQRYEQERQLQLQQMGMEQQAAADQAQRDYAQQEFENQYKTNSQYLDQQKWANDPNNPNSVNWSNPNAPKPDTLPFANQPEPTKLLMQGTDLLQGKFGAEAPKVAQGYLNYIDAIVQKNPMLVQNRTAFVQFVKANGAGAGMDPQVAEAMADSVWRAKYSDDAGNPAMGN